MCGKSARGLPAKVCGSLGARSDERKGIKPLSLSDGLGPDMQSPVSGAGFSQCRCKNQSIDEAERAVFSIAGPLSGERMNLVLVHLARSPAPLKPLLRPLHSPRPLAMIARIL